MKKVSEIISPAANNLTRNADLSQIAIRISKGRIVAMGNKVKVSKTQTKSQRNTVGDPANWGRPLL